MAMYVILKHYHVQRERYKKIQRYRSPGAQVGSEDRKVLKYFMFLISSNKNSLPAKYNFRHSRCAVLHSR